MAHPCLLTTCVLPLNYKMAMFNSKKGADRNEFPSATGILNIIGAGTIIEGDLTSEGDLRIDGTLKGHIKAKARFVLGENGSVEGDVISKDATIAGTIDGNITISDSLLLKATARVNGDILTDKIVVESGAQLNGKCSMKSSPSKPQLGKNSLINESRNATAE